MASITIYVSRNGETNGIKLRDSEGHNPGNDDITTDVSPNDSITWQLDRNSGLNSIDGVKFKSGTNLLKAGPNRGSDGTYSATVTATSPGKGVIESYQIGYTITGQTGTIWDDPKLKMKV